MNKRDARTEMMYELEQLQSDLHGHWLANSLPLEWNGLAAEADGPRARTRVTIRLDADMVRWFRRLGPGYSARINQVLRIYWLALLGGEIKAFPRDNSIPRLFNEARRIVDTRHDAE